MADAPYYRFGPFWIDVRRRRLLRDAEPIKLTPKAFDMLLLLVANHGRVIEKQEVMARLWPDTIVEEANVSQTIYTLRKILDAPGSQHIVTSPRVGYRFIARVEELWEEPSPWAAVDPRPSEDVTSAGSTRAADQARDAARERAADPWAGHEWLVFTGAILSVVAVMLPSLVVSWRHRSMPPRPAMVRFVMMPPAGTALSGCRNAAVSPDGARMAFVAADSTGAGRIYLRRFDRVGAQPFAGTEGASRPFWSPDGNQIGFFAQGKLKAIDVSGGPPRVLADAADDRGAAWSRNGTIIFAPSSTHHLFAVPALGGPVTPVTALDPDRREGSHRWPHFLPDGRHFLFQAWTKEPNGHDLYLGSLDETGRTLLMSVDSNVEFASGFLLYGSRGTLTARPFDVRELRLTGPAVEVANDVDGNADTGCSAFSASPAGVLAFERSTEEPDTQPTWFTRDGKMLDPIAPPGQYRHLDISHDERRAALERRDPKTNAGDLLVIDMPGGRVTRFTFSEASEWAPIWAPDGERIVFASNRDGPANLYQKAAGGPAEALLAPGVRRTATDWSRDGRFIVYEAGDPRTGDDLWLLPLAGDRTPRPYLRSEFDETQGRLSPDGRWMAYASDQSGRAEVYVQAMPPSGRRWQISTGGGADPLWRADGRELFYLAADRMLMAVAIEPGKDFRAGAPTPLFRTGVTHAADSLRHYAVSADGQRVLLNQLVGSTPVRGLSVIVNWTLGLRR